MRWFIDSYLDTCRNRPIRILDFGSQDVNGTYRSLFDDPQWTYVGADMTRGQGVDVVLSQPYHWRELKSSDFDLVISGQTFEHIEFPWVSILEIARVLRPHGLLCLVVPSTGHQHRFPVDCWRFYPDGLAALAGWGGLEVLEAITHWEDETWVDGSERWQDSVLVATKPQVAWPRSWVAKANQGMIRRVNAFQARRRMPSLEGRRMREGIWPDEV
jgi:SAM-dependent methyltransferase